MLARKLIWYELSGIEFLSDPGNLRDFSKNTVLTDWYFLLSDPFPLLPLQPDCIIALVQKFCWFCWRGWFCILAEFHRERVCAQPAKQACCSWYSCWLHPRATLLQKPHNFLATSTKNIKICFLFWNNLSWWVGHNQSYSVNETAHHDPEIPNKYFYHILWTNIQQLIFGEMFLQDQNLNIASNKRQCKPYRQGYKKYFLHWILILNRNIDYESAVLS